MEERFFHFQLTATVMARHKHMMPWKYEMTRSLVAPPRPFFFALDFCVDFFPDFFNLFFYFLIQNLFSGRFDTSGFVIPLLVPEIEGGYPERDGGGEEEEEEGQGWGNSSKLIRLIIDM